MSTPYDAPVGRANFLTPMCAVCEDSGERVIMTPTGDYGFFREIVPCTCVAGLLLVAQFHDAMAQYDLSHPITQDELNMEDDRANGR